MTKQYGNTITTYVSAPLRLPGFSYLRSSRHGPVTIRLVLFTYYYELFSEPCPKASLKASYIVPMPCCPILEHFQPLCV